MTSTVVPSAEFAAVLFDWRGTLVPAPRWPVLVRASLERLGREAGTLAVEQVLVRLRESRSSEVDSPEVDTDPAFHRSVFAAWFRRADLDHELAELLPALAESPEFNRFADDVAPTLTALAEGHVRIGVVSDIHFDVRPHFARCRTEDGRGLDELVEVWSLSFETGVAKPREAAFVTALGALALGPEEVLMVGDRGQWDGAATDLGMTTLLLPALRETDHRRLHRVLDLALPGRRMVRPV